MSIPSETRRESYHASRPIIRVRQDIILMLLGNRHMTAKEIADELCRCGYTPYAERNFAAPRLTELKQAGKVEAVGKKICRTTGRSVTVWAVKKEVCNNALCTSTERPYKSKNKDSL